MMNPSYHGVCVSGKPEWAQILKDYLSSLSLQLEGAERLDELTTILRKGIPDIIYLAAEMKSLDPFALCARLSKAGIPVFMASETPTHELLVKAARHGAMDVLVTPFQSAAVVSKTDRALIKTGKKAPPEGVGRKINFGIAKSPYDKVKVVIKNVKEVLALPFAVVKIIRLCNDPSASATDLEKPVQSDPAIAAMIMRRANSAAFAGIGKTSSIQRAIMRVGMRATRNIAASLSVFKLFSKEEKTFGFNRIGFWIHSLATGICAQSLATLLKYPQPEDAFLAGLLHDIGKMVLDDFLNEDFDRAVRMANTEGIPLRLAEKAVFEADHTYVGSKIADSWEFPSLISEGIGRHHLYERLTDKTEGLSIGTIVCMANQAAKAMQTGNGGDYIAEREASPLWNRLPKGFSWRDFIEKVFEELKAYTEVLEVPSAQFQVELPQRGKGKAGIFLPNSVNYKSLLQIVLERHGLETSIFSSLETAGLKESGFSLVLADLTSTVNNEKAMQFYSGVTSLSEKNVILPPTDEKNRPFHLDFFWLESQVRHALEPDNGGASVPSEKA